MLPEPPTKTDIAAQERVLYARGSSQSSSLFFGQPVNWYSWSDLSFEYAQRVNRPVFLLIGFQACDWCQEMARASFHDADVAAYLNENYVCIDVDRELRPDIDNVYQTLHLLLNGSPGGWPLTLFLCPYTRLPFHAGTFYRQSPQRQGELSFPSLLKKVNHFYRHNDRSCQRLLKQVGRNLSQVIAPPLSQPVPEEPQTGAALDRLRGMCDEKHGGFGTAPKFSLPINLNFLLTLAEDEQMSGALMQHLQRTLKILAVRGLQDHIGGGFFRYALDAEWHQPSFEKMLYDNGQLLEVFARAWVYSGSREYKAAVLGIVRWLTGTMRHPHGAFFSAQCSGSDGLPGSFYLYTRNQLEVLLSPGELAVFDALYGFDASTPNEPRHLSQITSLEEVAAQLRLQRDIVQKFLASGRETLERERYRRDHPRVDTNILVVANSSAIKGLAIAGRCFPQLLALAEKAVDFIRDHLWINHRLFASWQNGKPGMHAYLEDYAYLMEAVLELLQSRWRDSDYRLVVTLGESLMQLYEDEVHGGFFQSAHDAEPLVYRHKHYLDGSMPAANGVAARALLRLGYLSGEPRFTRAVERTLESASALIRHSPQHHLTLVQAHRELLQPIPLILMMDNGTMTDWSTHIFRRFDGRVLSFRLLPEMESLPPEVMGIEPGEAVVLCGEDSSPVCSSLVDLENLVNQFLHSH